MARRNVKLIGSLLACSGLLVAGCGDDDAADAEADVTAVASGSTAADPSTDATPASTTGDSAGPRATDGWSFVDGSGTEITLDEMPKRIVAHGTAAAALIPLGIRPVGIFADTKIDADLALNHLDLEGIEIVGEEWGVVNVEAVAALQPDLIVGEWWPIEKAYSGLEPGVSEKSKQMREIAPILGVSQGPSVVKMIEDYEELAVALGADLDASSVAADKQRFETARAGFEAAVVSKPGLTAMAISPTDEGLYVAAPEHAAELSDFVSWGLDLVVPDKPDPGFEYWETLSWENADKYQADLLIIDERSYPGNLEQATEQPTWQFLEAANADAVAVWPAFWLRNYADYAAALEALTDEILAADEDLVS